jgi:hypothetical protein
MTTRRNPQQRSNLSALPHDRFLGSHPWTTAKDRTMVVVTTDLTRLQRTILRLLGMPKAYSG